MLPLFAIALALCAAIATGCAHEVVWLGDEPAPVAQPDVPVDLTVAVVPRSFEAEGLTERGFVERFVQELRQAGLFQGVMFPVPGGARPMWELQLLVRDELVPSPGNFWREFWANVISPAGFFIWLETTYALEFEALLTRNGEIVRSYQTRGEILNRYQTRADQVALQRDALELVVGHTVAETLARMHADLGEIRALNER